MALCVSLARASKAGACLHLDKGESTQRRDKRGERAVVLRVSAPLQTSSSPLFPLLCPIVPRFSLPRHALKLARPPPLPLSLSLSAYVSGEKTTERDRRMATMEWTRERGGEGGRGGMTAARKKKE